MRIESLVPPTDPFSGHRRSKAWRRERGAERRKEREQRVEATEDDEVPRVPIKKAGRLSATITCHPDPSTAAAKPNKTGVALIV